MTLMWTLKRALVGRAARGGKFKVESGHGGTPPCVTESVRIRLKAEGLRRHERVELCRVCRVWGSGERRQKVRRINVVERRQREVEERGGEGAVHTEGLERHGS